MLGVKALPSTSIASWSVTNQISPFFHTPASPQSYLAQLLLFPLQEALGSCTKSCTFDYLLSTLHPNTVTMPEKHS